MRILILFLTGCSLIGCKTTDVPPKPRPPAVDAVIVTRTVNVAAGETFNGDGRTYVADPDALGDGSQREGQKALFELTDGSRIKNLTIGAPAADGIHVKLSDERDAQAVIERVTYTDVGEDAITAKTGRGLILIRKCKFRKAADKTVQVSNEFRGTVRAEDCEFVDVQKALRSGNEKRWQRLELIGGKVEDARHAIHLNQSKAEGLMEGVELLRVEDPVKEVKRGQVVVRK